MNDPRTSKAIFLDALALPTNERAAFVRQHCAADPRLLAEVSELLALAGESGKFLGSTTHGGAPGPADAVGQQMGPYRLVGVIGEGGFGTVYVAGQEEPVKRLVAFKIIKPGMDTKQVIRRFEAERQTLALLDHPGIAKVLDAGATPTGRPYFVMELIDGPPINVYCDKNSLSVADRLALFRQVCVAVQHAHQRGIIHRDIKPSNILVAMVDGQPQVKVIDFGIAKAIDSAAAGRAAFTEQRQLVGTPEYMSPEQAASSADLDTRTDVYSLGVLLYELLTGVTPLDGRRLRSAAYDEVQRLIREEDPPKPSTRLISLEGRLPEVASTRGVAPARLGAMLRGDLDWIVMKALDKDRTRRYDGPGSFALDIEAFLGGLPVTAAPPSAVYRASKFVRRHRVGVSVASVLVLTLVGATVGTTLAMLRARDAEREQAKLRTKAEDEADNAKREQRKAQAAANFMEQMIEGAAPKVAAGRDATLLLEVLDTAAARIEKGELKASPEAEITLRVTISDTYRGLAKYDRAKAVFAPVVAMAEGVIKEGGSRAYLADALNMRGLLEYETGSMHDGEASLRRSLDLYRDMRAGDHTETARVLRNLAGVLNELGKLQPAEAAQDEALSMLRRLGKDEGQDFARGLSMLGRIRTGLAKYAEAQANHDEGVSRQRQLAEGDSTELASALIDSASNLRALGRQSEAEPLTREAVEIRRRIFKGDNAAVVNGLAMLASLEADAAKYDDSQRNFTEALAMARRLYSGNHRMIATGLNNMGYVLSLRDKYEEAEPYYRDALEMRRRVYAGDHPTITSTIGNLARTNQALGRLDAALAGYQEEAEMRRRLYPQGHPSLAGSLASIAQILDIQGRPADALPLLDEASVMLAASLPPAHANRLQCDLQHAEVLLGVGGEANLARAEAIARAALAGVEGVAEPSRTVRFSGIRIRGVLGGVLLARALLAGEADRGAALDVADETLERAWREHAEFKMPRSGRGSPDRTRVLLLRRIELAEIRAGLSPTPEAEARLGAARADLAAFEAK